MKKDKPVEKEEYKTPILTNLDYFILIIIGKSKIIKNPEEKRNISITDLSSIIGVAFKNLLYHLKKLEDYELIYRDTKAIKGRTIVINITERGQKMLSLLDDMKISAYEHKFKKKF